MSIASTTRLRTLLSLGAATAALCAAPAYAQDTQTAEAAPADEGTIVVTGSLITNPNLERSTPVNVTTSEEVELRQTNVAEQLLRDVPGVVPSTGSNVNNGNGGASFVSLRGLGSNRNLILLDGNRVVQTDTVGRTDLNVLPLALIERTEVLTGGASTTYGADAISGVVNFITKKDFSGLEINAGEQITQRGDGNVFRVDATIGANFDDNRGNATFSVGYQESDPVYQGSRAISRSAISPYNEFDTTAAGSPTAIPSTFTVPGTAGLQINPAGALVPIFSSFNFNPFNLFQTPFKRFNMFGSARYEITDGIEAYTRGIFSKTTVPTIVAPSGVFGSTVTIPVSNPYLTPAARATFCANNDFNPGVAGVQTLTPAQCAAAAAATSPSDPNYRTFTTGLFRRTTEVGTRNDIYTTTFFDYRLGFRGDITESIHWDISGGYGESTNHRVRQNYVLTSRVRQALLATNPNTCLDTSNGCVPLNVFGQQGSITPAQAAFIGGVTSVIDAPNSLAQARAVVNGDFGASLPWANDAVSFAAGGEYRKYKSSIEPDNLAQTAGQLGGAGGAIRPTKGALDVYEAFGELLAPLVQDKPFFEDLTLEAGVRYSHYTIDAPGTPKFNTTTWKVGGSWTPIRDIKIRGNYAHAVRAPNINELFAPLNTVLTNLGVDPCAGVAPLNNANLRAVCLAQGAPAFTIGNIPVPAAGQVNVTGGGNLNLKPEKSNSYTIGAVIQPSVLPGFSLSVDYYKIKLTGAITTPTSQDIVNACFGNLSAASASNPACTSIRRDPNTGSLSGDAATTPGLFGALSNLGRASTDGVDLTMNYNTDLGFAKLALNFAGNWTRSAKFQATPTSLNRECVGFYSVSCGSPAGTAADIGSIQPEFSWTQRSTLTFDNVDLSLLWRHVSAVSFERQQFQDDLAVALASPADCPDPLGADPGGCIVDPRFRHIPAFDYFDLSTRIGVGDNLTLTVTVANLFDKKPPNTAQNIGSTSFNSGNTYPSTYDTLGRRFAVGARLRF
ncbi:TonB-dependent receptor domain-containing protein [Sphingomonas tabacisoli]|uniref:TonB-dependent receptor domain-containing protein n=1 Tax=Sphingomonas tabacisoli TaxID=2249466 RepID=A0ABW4I500_9SPHN